MINTDSNQDKQIEAAESRDHINNLISIINNLDQKIEAWKRATGANDPEDFLASLPD